MKTPFLLGVLLCTTVLGHADLIGFYSFDDQAAAFHDDSGSNHDLVAVDIDPDYTADGFEGGAFHFDGAQRLEVPIDVNPTTVPQLTWGAWVKTDVADVPGLYKIMGHDDGGWDRTIGLDNRDGAFRYTSFIGNGRPVVGTPGPVSNEVWAFVAAVYDQDANEVTVYVDTDAASTEDALATVTEPTGFASGLSTFSLGSLRPDSPTEGWVGFIDNAFVFDEALDAGQIKAVRDGGKEAILGDLAPNDPAIAVSPPDDIFGRLPAGPGRVERAIPVANAGSSQTLTFSSVTVQGTDAALYQIASSPASLAPGAVADIVVAFDPGDASGDFTALLVIQTNDVAVPEVTIDLSARVAAPSVSGTLIGFYTFDDAANPLADASGNGRALTLPGGDANPAYDEVAGFQGGAYTFDGGDRLVAPININPGELPEVTIGAWVKTASVEPALRKILGHDNGGWDRTIGLDNREGDFRYTAFIGNGRPVVGTPGPVADQWAFIAVTFDDPNQEVTVFVDPDVSSLDDDLVSVTEPTGFGPGFDTFAIGGLRPDTPAEGWIGEIDNIFLAEGVLSAEQLDRFRAGGRGAIEHFGFGPPREHLIGFWNFDNPENPVEDASGNGKDLDPDRAPPTHAPAGGFEGGAYVFSGSQRLVADIDINASELPQMTWGAWVKTDSLTPGLRKIMGHDDGGWDRTIGLDDRLDIFRYTSFTGGSPMLGTPGPENTEDWTFIAVSYDEDQTEATVYLDLDARSTGDPLVTVTSEEPTVFGSGFPEFSIGSLRPDNPSEGWVGSIDNAFIYGTVLSPAQIAFMRDGGGAAILGASGDNPDLFLDREFAFGALPDRAPVTRSLTIRNGGRTEMLLLSGVTPFGPDASFYEITQFPPSLAPGQSGVIEVAFDPRDQAGKFSAQLRVESNDASQPLTVISLDATTPSPATADPLLTGPLLSPFGTLTPGTHQRTLTLQNTGTARELVISSIQITGQEAANYNFGALPGPIPAGGTGTVSLTFDSAGDFGNFRAALRVLSNDGRNRVSEINVSALVPIQNPEDALIAYYSFDDPANPLKDDSEKGPTLEIPEAEPAYLANGGFEGGGAYEFDGSQRLVADININTSEIPELTLGAWVKPSNLDPGLKKIMGHDNGGWDRTIGLDNRDGEFRYTAFIGNGRPVLGTPGPANTDDWAFIAVVYDQSANEVTVYVDVDASTTEDELVAVSEPTLFNEGQPTVSIGSLRPDNNSEGWVGFIDRAFFFNAALDAATVRELRDGGILPGGEDPNIRLRGSFGNLGKNPGAVTREITVQNGGREQVLTLTGARITGPDAANYTLTGELPASLEPGASATLDVRLNPGGRSGGFVAFLEIDSSDPGDPTASLDLSAVIPNANDLLAHYKLDEADGTAVLDASGNGAHGTYGTMNGGAFTLAQAPLASGQAVVFDDANDAGAGFANIPASAGLPELTHFSVSLWLRQDPGDAGVSALFAKGTGENPGDPFAVATTGGALVWFSAGAQTLTVADVITPGETTHLVTTYSLEDGIPTAAFFVNGVEVGRESNVEPFDDSRPSTFEIGSLNGGFGFKGTLDDVQLYGRALTAEDVLFLFNNPGTLLPGETDPAPGPLPIATIRKSAGGLDLTLPGQVSWDIEFSLDLRNWELIGSEATDSFSDTDPSRTQGPAGFYRARQN